MSNNGTTYFYEGRWRTYTQLIPFAKKHRVSSSTLNSRLASVRKGELTIAEAVENPVLGRTAKSKLARSKSPWNTGNYLGVY